MLTKNDFKSDSRLTAPADHSRQFTFSFGDENLRGRVQRGRDHVEMVPHECLASVSDRGKNHHTNQDDARVRLCTIDSSRVSIMVVCDGVSGGTMAEEASQAAATAASDSLFKHLVLGGDPREAMRHAIGDADEAVRNLSMEQCRPGGEPPGTTIVAAVVIRRRLIVGWVGDSRCYLVEPENARLLTHDHSWVNDVVEAGQMTEEQAYRRREAHHITRCLGPLYGNQTTDRPEPSIAVYRLPSAGKILLCTDGLWNYAPTADDIARLLPAGPDAPTALTQARSLVQFAVDRGGKDNITAAVLTI